MFIDNKYTKLYYKIICNAQERVLPAESYKEKHHVIPCSIGGTNLNENIVPLTAREHFICHWLLTKMTIGKEKRSMACALRMMLAYTDKHQRYIISSKKYELVKKLANSAAQGRPCAPETREKIRQGNLKRDPCSPETRIKLSEAAKRRKGFTNEGRQRVIAANRKRMLTDEQKDHLRKKRLEQVERQGSTMTATAREKLSKAAKGRILSAEHKDKISKAHIGKIISEETRLRMSNSKKGRKHSEEYKKQLSVLAKGKPKKQVQCPYCNKIGGEPQMKRWHFDNCKVLLNYKE
jgi:hypothetical protein